MEGLSGLPATQDGEAQQGFDTVFGNLGSTPRAAFNAVETVGPTSAAGNW